MLATTVYTKSARIGSICPIVLGSGTLDSLALVPCGQPKARHAQNDTRESAKELIDQTDSCAYERSQHNDGNAKRKVAVVLSIELDYRERLNPSSPFSRSTESNLVGHGH